MKLFSLITVILLFACGQISWAQTTATNDADTAWEQVKEATTLPTPPGEWNTTPPTDDQLAAFRKQFGQAAIATAEKARAFYTDFPTSPHAPTAKMLEATMLQDACIRGNVDAFEDWQRALTNALADTRLTGDMRFQLRVQDIQRIGVMPGTDDNARTTVLEKALWQLAKDYPDQVAPYALLLNLAGSVPEAQGRAIANQILADKAAPDDAKQGAQSFLQRLDAASKALGKPVAIQFTAVDGRQVDLSQMKGKVVLVDFWATWCGPCVAEMPDVKATYDKYHSKGFDIVGISLDQDKDALMKFIQAHDIAWPQYFDGLGWQNKFAVQFGIQGIPAMWLVDKDGKLQTENARGDLQGQVESLLKGN
jgi:thiol-disulfide isomerase/thioredoxin